MLQKASEARTRKKRRKPIPDKFWTWIEGHVRWRVWRVELQFNLSREDKQDMRQEILTDIAKRWRWYDPKRSPAKAFVSMLVTNWFADYAKMRNGEYQQLKSDAELRTAYLSEEVATQDGDEDGTVERGDLVSEDDNRRRRGLRKRSALEQLALEQDVRRLVAKLPPDLRQICEYVMKYDIPTAAERLKIPLSTFRLKLKRLRQHFGDLQCYLDQPSE